MSEMKDGPMVSRWGLLSMQVCVPAEYNDDDVLRFAEKEYPCGTTNGWGIRREGDEALNGSPERVCCQEREGYVHVMLDA